MEGSGPDQMPAVDSGTSPGAGPGSARRWRQCLCENPSCRSASRRRARIDMTPNELPDAARPSDPAAHGSTPESKRAALYVARILQQHLVDDPTHAHWTVDGSAAFVDISGFTSLSELLARKGREGAEQITGVIGHVFENMLAVAYDNGGSLIKFGGDSLLLWFQDEDHVARACRAAVLMRQALADAGRVELPDASATLRMSQGVHSGQFHFFAVGTSHLELLATGPAWTRLVEIQHSADADEILVSEETAKALPAEC